MNLITLTEENLAYEHICCAISNNNDIQVSSKKAWLKERIKDGLVFTKGDVRGKCFIEYIPSENAWAPVEAPGFMYINCLWVSGQFKGKGYSNELLESCIKRKDLFYIIQASVRLLQNMFRCLKKLLPRKTCHSNQFILNLHRKRRMRRQRQQYFAFFTMVSMLQTRFYRKRNLMN